MTNEQFSNQFDTLVNSYLRFRDFDNKEPRDTIEFNEFEKSLYLTQAQEEVIVNLYNGKNPYGDSFESTEELRRYLDSLVNTKLYKEEDRQTPDISPVSKSSVFFKLPEDIAFITFERVTFEDEDLGCYNGEVADVYPVTQDEYNRIMRNPFRGPSRYRVLRMDTGDSIVELISKFNIGEYLIKYVERPAPIVLVNLPEGLEINGISEKTSCQLNEILHSTILKRAVQLALISKQINFRDNGEK